MKQCVNGLELKGVATIDKSNCVICCEGKQTRLPFTTIGTRSNQVLDVIHGDLCGPMDETSIGGSKYFILVDDYSRMSFVFFLNKFVLIKNVVGATDGSHISINKPKGHDSDYVNRKGQYSINLQGTVDHKKLFIDVYCGEPGSLHDARVLKRSSLHKRAVENW